MIKKFFPGANTAWGFLGHFEGIVPPWEPDHYTYILKGGPGVGKNTFMKKVACIARAEGYATEEFRCASDPDSLDAVRIPEKKLVLLDGTAPHALDPEMPGIDGEIVNLGYFRHRKAFVQHRGTLTALQQENRDHYAAAYRFLSAAGALQQAALHAVAPCMDAAALQSMVEEYAPKDEEPTPPRTLFLRTATPEGILCTAETIEAAHTLQLPLFWGQLALQTLRKAAKGRCWFSPDFLTPSLPHALYFPTGDLLLQVSDTVEVPCTLRQSGAMPHTAQAAAELLPTLLENAVHALRHCKTTHDEIEKLYRPFVDYRRVDQVTEDLLDRLFS